jgi:hypothetical protein
VDVSAETDLFLDRTVDAFVQIDAQKQFKFYQLMIFEEN